MASVLISCSHDNKNNVQPSPLIPSPYHKLVINFIHQVSERLIIYDRNGQELVTTPNRPCPSRSESFVFNPFCSCCHSKLVDYIVSLGNSEEHSNLVAESLRSRVENWLNLFQHVLHPNETTNYYFKLESLISRGCYYDDEVVRAWIEHESFEEDFAATKPTPASEAAIEALERLVAGGDQEVDSTTCAICLEEGSMMMSVKLPCKHVFHEGCIVKWLHKSNDCPLCRYKFPVANMDQQVAFGTS